MVDWIAFLQVGFATIAAALVVVGVYGLGVRLQAVAEDEGRSSTAYRAWSWVCFALCGVVVLIGVILIVPQLHGLIGL